MSALSDIAGGFSREAGRLCGRIALTALAGSLAAPMAFDAAHAYEEPGLYSAVVVVTGEDNLEERARGIREALPLVLTKLTVDGALAQHAVENGMTEDAATLVDSFSYHDRKEGVQISDEQGTRERSFELTVTFDRRKIDAMVASLGGKVWTSKRPRVGIVLMIDDGASAYVLTQTSERGYGQRWAMEDAADALALPLDLPAASTGETAESALPALLPNTPLRLEGRMKVTPEGYWDTHWHLTGLSVDERFASAGVTFDTAIEEALRQSARVLSKTLN